MDGQNPRDVLAALIRDRGEDCASLSRMIGRNPAYVQQYLRRGTPRRLSETDRATLARYFDVAETSLGAAPRSEPAALRRVPRLAVAASAGPGAVAQEGRGGREIGFSDDWLRDLHLPAGPARLSVIEVSGTSMLPTLAPGDEILVDAADTAPREGIFVIRIGDALHVKRLVREGGRLRIRSDNRSADPVTIDDPESLAIVGRVRWRGRRLD